MSGTGEVTDRESNRVKVVFGLDHLQQTLKELEEMENIPFEQAIYEIRRDVSR